MVLPETIHEYLDFVDAENCHWLFYYIWAADLAKAFEAAVNLEGLKYGVFFISADDTSHPLPTQEWYQNIIGSVPEIKNPLWYQRNPRASVFSSAAAKNILGWQPSTDFTQLRAQYAQAATTH